jgi:hypothetical protein
VRALAKLLPVLAALPVDPSSLGMVFPDTSRVTPRAGNDAVRDGYRAKWRARGLRRYAKWVQSGARERRTTAP